MTDEMWYLIEQQAKQLTELSARINRSDEVDKQYAALRIEELERDLEECQKAKNVLMEALESVLSLIDESLGVAGFHLNGDVATWGELALREELEAAIKKARGGCTGTA